MFAIRATDGGAIVEVRLATYDVFLSMVSINPAWQFVDHNRFLLDTERADFMANPTSYALDTDGLIYKTTDPTDNDMSQFTNPWDGLDIL